MASTRKLVLKHLLTHQRSTIKGLAKAVKIDPISVRHHIGRLEKDGLVASAEERHGVGRPRRVYFLTEAGVEQFPGRTVRFTKRLIDDLKENLPAEEVQKLFVRLASRAASELPDETEINKLSLDQRLKLMKSWLTNEGFNVHVQRTGKQLIIKETGCPYYYVGQSHAEVCGVDKALIAKALSADPMRVSCLLHGDSHCTYVVPLAAVKQNVSKLTEQTR